MIYGSCSDKTIALSRKLYVDLGYKNAVDYCENKIKSIELYENKCIWMQVRQLLIEFEHPNNPRPIPKIAIDQTDVTRWA